MLSVVVGRRRSSSIILSRRRSSFVVVDRRRSSYSVVDRRQSPSPVVATEDSQLASTVNCRQLTTAPKGGRLQKACELIVDMRDRGVKPDGWTRGAVVCALAVPPVLGGSEWDANLRLEAYKLAKKLVAGKEW